LVATRLAGLRQHPYVTVTGYIRFGRMESWKVHRISAFNHAIQPPDFLVVGYFESC
jgi:hypothetical protein